MVPFYDLEAVHEPMKQEMADAFTRVLQTHTFILGPEVEAFEQAFARYVGRKHCVGVNSGTSALHLALLGCGVEPGDEVITTPHTWVSTSWAISYCGARPVFADVDAGTGNIDVGHAESLVTPRTKAVLPVDLYGNPADLTALERMAERRGLVLVDDACQAHGSRLAGKMVGSFGHAACFSFYPGKNLGALGEGGAVVTDEDALADRMRVLRDHAQAGRHHHVDIGFNYRMEAVQGALLGVKLPYVECWNDGRRRAARRYFDMLGGVAGARMPCVTGNADPNWHLFVVRVSERDEVRARLGAAGVETGVHYPVPVHLQPAYAHLGYRRGELPVAEAFAASCLSLPMYPTIGPEQQGRVAEALAEALTKVA